ncbi:DNA-binding response regulator [Actinoalloteichus sp. AHMU CJ021]|uniref:DNA-binding response regulator, OmpR family, contains REC and winged-helix (WHTH) domain n=1 Tax=Actinoalloteichus caeruleus DSM 43889 TaxID=1120930 RepID=A0ABT1JLS3_ACTCY|nr:response regulator transcription factor [Actinoalloteichus caeruleus]AUS81692.1 DNA-binding response regulator [Actinoalloteichus sp. AHMU CJ021]MCP2333214.1 DNA-binding response regulator, OmpR family, contains REC and winged-helix (wHTH) domain [Actinoalloteichus caeruleus DSM 43889]
MAGFEILLLTSAPNPHAVLPALSLLPHWVQVAPPEPTTLIDRRSSDLILVDATTDLAEARRLCALLEGAGSETPVVAIVGEGGLVALTEEWGVADFLLPTAGPAEVEARLRLVRGRGGRQRDGDGDVVAFGDLVIEEATYTARLRGRALELTYKEFELLKYLAQHAGRVFTRAQLLQEVWGYDFFGGARTVDVHVRRLRAKLGPEHEQLIGTVRNVGYKFVRLGSARAARGAEVDSTPESGARPERGAVPVGRGAR